MSPELCSKLERWQGPPHINKGKQLEIVLSFGKRRDFVYSICLHINKLFLIFPLTTSCTFKIFNCL